MFLAKLPKRVINILPYTQKVEQKKQNNIKREMRGGVIMPWFIAGFVTYMVIESLLEDED